MTSAAEYRTRIDEHRKFLAQYAQSHGGLHGQTLEPLIVEMLLEIIERMDIKDMVARSMSDALPCERKGCNRTYVYGLPTHTCPNADCIHKNA